MSTGSWEAGPQQAMMISNNQRFSELPFLSAILPEQTKRSSDLEVTNTCLGVALFNSMHCTVNPER